MLRCCQDAIRKAGGDFGADLREFDDEDDHVHLLGGYRCRCRRWWTRWRACRRGGCGRSSPAAWTSTSCTGKSGPRPTSPHPAAARRWASSGGTSSSKDTRLMRPSWLTPPWRTGLAPGLSGQGRRRASGHRPRRPADRRGV